VAEEVARYAAAEVFKRLFWAGYRGAFEVVDWEGDELNPLFDPNVVNAFQSAPSMLEYLRDYMPSHLGSAPVRTNVMAHSLGNLVTLEALRMYLAASPGVPVPRLFNNLISFEAAVWEETLWDQVNQVYTSDAEEYSVDELKTQSWCFWFNQAQHPTQAALSVDGFYVSRITEDSALRMMQLNDWTMRFSHFFRDNSHGYRVGGPDSSDITEGGTPDLADEIPAMLQPPTRYADYLYTDLTHPLGMTWNPPTWASNIFAEDFNWQPHEHSDYLEAPYWSIYRWYDHLLTGAIPFEAE
jgi:hypothetical protein